MGRKIPAKKHRGVKDPLVQQAKRFESLKSKINAPPRDPDEQPVPKSLLRLFGVDKEAEERKKKKKLKWKAERAGELSGREKGRGSNPVAKLKRLPGESARAFSRRITGAARALHDATDAQHYPVEEEEDEDRVRRRRRGRGAGAGGEQPSRAQRRHARLQHRKKERSEAAVAAAAAAGREVRYERLPFGETAHAPPALAPPRLPRALRPGPSAPRPGRRDLLLTRLLSGGPPLPGSGGAEGPQARAARELRRLDAVAAYRALRAKGRPAPAQGGAAQPAS